jgi:hypothetical protein
MILWIFQITILSIIFIFLVHSLILFFKATLTVPKVKDLVNTSQKKYDKIFNVLSNTASKETIKDYTISSPDMKNELKNFFKSQIESINTSTPIDSLLNNNNPYYELNQTT